MIDIQGHRGCRGLFPENTLAAFEEALKMNHVKTLELDLVISKDKKVVVSHEPYMNHLFATKPNGNAIEKNEEMSFNLYKMDYSEIVQYDVGQRGNVRFPEQTKMKAVKPLLSDLFTMVLAYEKENPNRKIYFNIEIKSEEKQYDISQPQVKEFCDLVYAQFKAYGLWEQLTMQSFDFNVLKHWHDQTEKGLYKKIKLAALAEKKGPKKTIKELGFYPEIFSPNYKIIRPNWIKFCHSKTMAIIPWTVNETDTMVKLIDLGVDGIITDYPNRALAIIKR